MPDDLYHRDVLAWSEHQADLLRRVGRGERVNDIDWELVAEEIEDVGLSELHSVESYLELILAHLMKIHGWPDSPSVRHWWSEVVTFQRNMRRRFAPSMRQRIDMADAYTGALETLEPEQFDGQAPRPWPETCPFTLDQLLNERRAGLEAILAAQQPQG